MGARLLKRLKWDSSYFSTSSFLTSLFPVKDFKRGTIVKVVSNRFIVLRIHALFVFFFRPHANLLLRSTDENSFF